MSNLEVHHIQFRSESGSDLEENLITYARHATPEYIMPKATNGLEGIIGKNVVSDYFIASDSPRNLVAEESESPERGASRIV
jgi:hypothetical protein